MAESSEFTPEQTALHAFWADAWQRCRETLGQTTEQATEAAEAMMSVAAVVFGAFNGWAEAAARLRMVATKFENHLSPASDDASTCAVAMEELRKTTKILSDCGVPDQAILDGLLCLTTNSAISYCGKEGAAAVLHGAAVRAVGGPESPGTRH